MKGLLLKDFYLVTKYCRTYFLIAAVFIAVSFVSDGNLFYIVYPSLLSGMVPTTLLAYDERSRWNEYIGTLPYTKAQIVSGKYITGLAVQILVLVLIGIAQAVRMCANGVFDIKDYMSLISVLFVASCVASSLTLPFIFKWGVEKGRLAYFVIVGIGCAGAVAVQSFFYVQPQMKIPTGVIFPVSCIAGIFLYALSWYLSIVFYKKREIK